ncbi:MAG: hypothetical protein AAGD86_00345 [Pseudomonadota bacterium]
MELNAANSTNAVEQQHAVHHQSELVARQVTDDQLYQVTRTINGDGQLLATSLQEGNWTRADQNALIAELVRSDRGLDHNTFYNELRPLSGEQQRVIGEALNQAYVDGAISREDLLNLSDFNQLGNGAQRLISVLDASPLSSQPGNSIEALGDALLNRANANPGTEQSTRDYYGAAIAFSQGSGIYARNQGTHAEAIAMFDATVQINQQGFSGLPGNGELYQSWRDEGLAAASRSFADHPELITSAYTNVPADTTTLANFFSQTLLNPTASDIQLDSSRSLVEGVNAGLEQVTGALVAQAQTAGSQLEREAAMQQLGALAASVGGAAAVSLSEYSDQINRNEAFRDNMASILNSAIKPFFKALPPPAATVAGNTTQDIVASIVGQFLQNPERPDITVSGQFIDALESSIREFEVANGFDGLLTAFQASRAAEIGDLQRDLNLNLGGYR